MKILIVHATAGAGHMKAAEAIYNGLCKNSVHVCRIIDSLDYTSPRFKELYRNTYFYFISKVPWVWGWFFELLDKPWIQPVMRVGRRIYNGLNTKKFVQYLKNEKFDVIVSTHFLSTEVAAALKRSRKIRSKLITVITDYDAHKIWTAEGVDVYAVACPYTKEKLISMGIDPSLIYVTGIPTDEKFSKRYDIKALKRRLNLKEDVFTVLMATGSFGIGPIEQTLEALKDQQVLVICGHNKDLYARLSPKVSDRIKIYGLVDNMHELMAVSDCMITKPGGLSISEALVSQLPLIFFNAIPGQETNNIKVLHQYGIGIQTSNIDEIVAEIKRLQSSKDTFLTALKKTQELARPSAVLDIIRIINN